MDPNFRKHAKQEIKRLLTYWRTIETGIKRAEQINGAAVIPAINELRYASRQLFMAQALYDRKPLNDGLASSISKRIIIAEQYLMNADHDTIDSIISYYRKEIKRLTIEFGKPEITIHYPQYPLLCNRVDECEDLVEQTRNDYDKRRENYNLLRRNHFPHLIAEYKNLENSEIDALYTRRKLETEIRRLEGQITLYKAISIVGSVCSIVGIPLAVCLAIYFSH